MGGEGRCYMVVVVVALSVLVVSRWWLEGVVAAVVRLEIEFKSDFPGPTKVIIFRMPPGVVVNSIESLFSHEDKWEHQQSVELRGDDDSKTEVWEFDEDHIYYIIYLPTHRGSPPVCHGVGFRGGDRTKKWLCQGSSEEEGGIKIGPTKVQAKFNEEEEGVVAAKVRVEIEFKSDFLTPTKVHVFRMPPEVVVHGIGSLFSNKGKWEDLREIDFVTGGDKSKTEDWQFDEHDIYYIIYEPSHPGSHPVCAGVRFHSGDGTKKWLCEGISEGEGEVTIGRTKVQAKFNHEEEDGKRD